MSTSAPIFYDNVLWGINIASLILALVLIGVAFVHCLTQRGDAFAAIGSLPKGGWLAILGICLLLSLLLNDSLSIFRLIGIGAALVYLLDVRPGLKDLTDGKGFW
ncbi:Protein of unknown function [Asanoa hainanensis]|uniref:DUF2516 domain-containing protein n=1 Tax=Asanoa hainanensis TaxID=560556 RepID=A0A239P3U6_9ACTN|nr:DUF2516 family protein [Asanoa hainanensis]SNT61652.1 Protein of unknown function [Asanoa hainanensis]